MSKVMVQFRHIPEDRESELFGPFEYAQLTYTELHVSDGKTLAEIDDSGRWYIHGDDQTPWTDVCIYPVGVARP